MKYNLNSPTKFKNEAFHKIRELVSVAIASRKVDITKGLFRQGMGK